MVRAVWEATQSADLLRAALPALLREHDYWTSPPKQVSVLGAGGGSQALSRYYAAWQEPRPESYR